MATYTFTSESVTEGHPDKMADQVSDAILDAILAEDQHARVACETLFKTGMAVIAGEITTSAKPDYEQIIRDTIRDIGYTSSEMGFDADTCAVLSAIGIQSPDINQGVDRARPEEQGAGDQGLMFGYATNETDVLMPAPIYYAHELVKRQSLVRRTTDDGRHHLRPDAKSQVTFRYEDGQPVGIEAVVLSTQHSAESTQAELRELVMDEIIKPVLPAEWLDGNTKYHINPTGAFVTSASCTPCQPRETLYIHGAGGDDARSLPWPPWTAPSAAASDEYLQNVSSESLEVLQHFGAEAPALLNRYACVVEDALLAQARQATGARVDGKAGDAVVAPVRGVEPVA